MSAQGEWDDNMIAGLNFNPPAAPAVDSTELWAKHGSLMVIKFDQMDDETSVIDSPTLRRLLAKSGYEFISAHQKEDIE